ncbi:MAG: hypothetical protein ACM3VZ_14170 [Acidobacteriota bacterium]
MDRLQSELRRLYLPHHLATSHQGDSVNLLDTQGRVRAMVLEVGRPASWRTTCAVWQGVQTELSLPAPAIAVSGVDAYQLWFSLVEPVSADEATRFLACLCQRYLSELPADRVACVPAPPRLAVPMPPRQTGTDQWSAFVAPDLAPVFAESPWLDLPPSTEGQADLLAALNSIGPADWRTAWQRLTPPAATPATASSTAPGALATLGPYAHPHDFLLAVMNDDAVPLHLRIEAAKALLPDRSATR